MQKKTPSGTNNGVQLDVVVSDSGTGVGALLTGVGVGEAPTKTGTSTLVCCPVTDEVAYAKKSRPPLTLLGNGMVLVAGGGYDNVGGDVTSSAELYDPVSNRWIRTGALLTVIGLLRLARAARPRWQPLLAGEGRRPLQGMMSSALTGQVRRRDG